MPIGPRQSPGNRLQGKPRLPYLTTWEVPVEQIPPCVPPWELAGRVLGRVRLVAEGSHRRLVKEKICCC